MGYYRSIGGDSSMYNHILNNNEERDYEDALEFTEHNNNARMLLDRLFGSRDNFEQSYKDRYSGIKQFKPAWDFVEMDKQLSSRKVKETRKVKRNLQYSDSAPLPPSNNSLLTLGGDSPFRNALRKLSSDSPFWDEPNFIYVVVKAIENLIVASATFIISVPFTLLENIFSFSSPSPPKGALSGRPSRTIAFPFNKSPDTIQYDTFQSMYQDSPPTKPKVKAITSSEFKRKIKKATSRLNSNLRKANFNSPSMFSESPQQNCIQEQFDHERGEAVSNVELKMTHAVETEINEASKTVREVNKEVGGKAVWKEGGDGAFVTFKENPKEESQQLHQSIGQTGENPKQTLHRATPQATQTCLDEKGLSLGFLPAAVLKKPSRSIKIADKSGEPIHLFNSQGYPLCDECGCLLADPEGKFLVVCDPLNYPICCRNGDSIYLGNGTSWLSHKESSSVQAIVVIEPPSDPQPTTTPAEQDEKNNFRNKKEMPKDASTIVSKHLVSRTERKYEFRYCDSKQEELQLQEFFPHFQVHKLFAKIEKIEADLKSLSEESFGEQRMVDVRKRKTIFHRRPRVKEEIEETPREKVVQHRWYHPRSRSPTSLPHHTPPLVISFSDDKDHSLPHEEPPQHGIYVTQVKQEKGAGRRWLRRRKKSSAKPTVICENTEDDLQDLYQRLQADLNTNGQPESFPIIEQSPSLTPGEYLRRCINAYTKNSKSRDKKKAEGERRFTRLKRKFFE